MAQCKQSDPSVIAAVFNFFIIIITTTTTTVIINNNNNNIIIIIIICHRLAQDNLHSIIETSAESDASLLLRLRSVIRHHKLQHLFFNHRSSSRLAHENLSSFFPSGSQAVVRCSRRRVVEKITDFVVYWA
jgi:hypothetical protein